MSHYKTYQLVPSQKICNFCLTTRRSHLLSRYKMRGSSLHSSCFAIFEFVSCKFAVSKVLQAQVVVVKALHVTSTEYDYRHIPSSTSGNVSVMMMQSSSSCQRLSCHVCPFVSLRDSCRNQYYALRVKQRRSPFNCCAQLRPDNTEVTPNLCTALQSLPRT